MTTSTSTSILPTTEELNATSNLLYGKGFFKLNDIERERTLEYTIAAIQSYRLGLLLDLFCQEKKELAA